MGNYPDGMTQADHDREFNGEPDDGVDLYYNGEWRLRTTPEGYEVKCPRCGQTNTHENDECVDCGFQLVILREALMEIQQ